MTFLRGVYWDLDGTIANTELEAHLPAFNNAFYDYGLNWCWTKQEYIGLLKINGEKIGFRIILELLMKIYQMILL